MNKINKESILNYVPIEKLNLFNIFKMKTEVNVSLDADTMKYKVSILKWYDLLGFVIKNGGREGENIYIVATKYYDDKIRFKLWIDGYIIKVGGLIDKNGNLIELWKEYDYGNPIPLRKKDKEYALLELPIVAYTLPFIDMFYMFDNIKNAERVAYGSLNNKLTSIFSIRTRDTMRYYRDQQIYDIVTYYLYYDNSMSLYAIERRVSQDYYGKDSCVTLQIESKRKYLKDKEIMLLEHINNNQ